MTTIVALVAAYVAERALFVLIKFDYNPFRDSFELGGVMTTVIVFIGFFLVIKALLDMGRGSRRF
jgi:hypothetical protein